MTKTTPRQMIDWINEELVNISHMRDKKKPDPYFDKQAAMFKDISLFIAAHMVSMHEWIIPTGIKYECCKNCGFVRNAANNTKPCPGKVFVGPRVVNTEVAS